MQMIYINDNLYVGKGSERYCYRHPKNSNLCIKLDYKKVRKNKQNKNEYVYYKNIEKRITSWKHIPYCYGWVSTNMGMGLAFDYIHDEQGAPCKSVKYHLDRKTLTRQDLEAPLDELYSYLMEQKLIVNDLNPSNLLCKFEGKNSFRLYLVDGLANRDFIKLADYVPTFARAKINRHWNRLLVKLCY
ncbi:PhoP regulatory network protein YrbL [Chromohalobacter israelensis]|nr:PhoP regulatory network protein YrbL [Chromohalobacter salexigens]